MNNMNWLIIMLSFLAVLFSLLAIGILALQHARFRELAFRGLPFAILASSVVPSFAALSGGSIPTGRTLILTPLIFAVVLGISIMAQSQRCRSFLASAVPYLVGGFLLLLLFRFWMTPTVAVPQGGFNNVPINVPRYAPSKLFVLLLFVGLIFAAIAMLRNTNFRRFLARALPIGLIGCAFLVPFLVLFSYQRVDKRPVPVRTADALVSSSSTRELVNTAEMEVHGDELVEISEADEHNSHINSDVAVRHWDDEPPIRFDIRSFVPPFLTVSICCAVMLRISKLYD